MFTKKMILMALVITASSMAFARGTGDTGSAGGSQSLAVYCRQNLGKATRIELVQSGSYASANIGSITIFANEGDDAIMLQTGLVFNQTTKKYEDRTQATGKGYVSLSQGDLETTCSWNTKDLE